MQVSFSVRLNRHAWLAAMRSGFVEKGPIEVDDQGRPSDPNATRCCAVGLMYSMFTLPGDGEKAYWDRLGVGQKEVAWIQQELNGSPLTFPEIADIVSNTLGWE